MITYRIGAQADTLAIPQLPDAHFVLTDGHVPPSLRLVDTSGDTTTQPPVRLTLTVIVYADPLHPPADAVARFLFLLGPWTAPCADL